MDADAEGVLSAQDINRLKWRCRRGLLENDLFIERFFLNHEDHLTQQQANALMGLMELADNDLLDLLLARKELEPPLHTPTLEVLKMLRDR